jgi:hypothetical protein
MSGAGPGRLEAVSFDDSRELLCLARSADSHIAANYRDIIEIRPLRKIASQLVQRGVHRPAHVARPRHSRTLLPHGRDVLIPQV